MVYKTHARNGKEYFIDTLAVKQGKFGVFFIAEAEISVEIRFRNGTCETVNLFECPRYGVV